MRAGNARAVTARPLSPPSGANVYGSFSHSAASSGKRFFLHFAPRHLFPATVVNFAEPIARLHFQFMRRGENLCRFNRAAKRRCVNRRNLFAAQAFCQSPRLFAAFIGKCNIGRAGKPIFRAQNRRAMPHHEDTRCC